MRNAEEMVNVGAAVVLEEKQLQDPSELRDELIRLLGSPEKLAAMGAAARTQAHLEAAERIVDRLLDAAARGKARA